MKKKSKKIKSKINYLKKEAKDSINAKKSLFLIEK